MSLVGPRPALRQEVAEFPSCMPVTRPPGHHRPVAGRGPGQPGVRRLPAARPALRRELVAGARPRHPDGHRRAAADAAVRQQQQGEMAATEARRRPARRGRAEPTGAARVMAPRTRDRSTARSHVGRGGGGSGEGSKEASSCHWPPRRARSGSTPSARPARYAAPSAVVSGRSGRCTGTPSWSAWNCSSRPSPTRHRRRAARSAPGRWPAPSPRRHRGSGTPSTRRRPGPGGRAWCRG